MLALQAARRRGCARPDRPSWSGIVIRADAFVPQFAQHMELRARMRRTLFASLDMAAKEAEEEARGIISAGVQHFSLLARSIFQLASNALIASSGGPTVGVNER